MLDAKFTKLRGLEDWPNNEAYVARSFLSEDDMSLPFIALMAGAGLLAAAAGSTLVAHLLACTCAHLPLRLVSVVLVAAALVAGCSAVRDVASAPAAVSEERHTGAFAAGASLSFDAALKPLDPSPVKDIRIDVSHKVIDLAPGVKVQRLDARRPGARPECSRSRRRQGPFQHDQPHRRNHAGNDSGWPRDDAFDGLSLGGGLAAEHVPLDRARADHFLRVRSGYPGVFMYHCVTPQWWKHVAAGMYGAMIVEPQGGFPTKPTG